MLGYCFSSNYHRTRALILFYSMKTDQNFLSSKSLKKSVVKLFALLPSSTKNGLGKSALGAAISTIVLPVDIPSIFIEETSFLKLNWIRPHIIYSFTMMMNEEMYELRKIKELKTNAMKDRLVKEDDCDRWSVKSNHKKPWQRGWRFHWTILNKCVSAFY